MTETRRRGAALESAIHEAAWAELNERGYSGMTFESVAERAHTSKPVLYRRWPTKEAMMLAAVGYQGIMRPSAPPDTGTLRDDTIALLRNFNLRADGVAGLFSSLLSSYFAETGISPAELRLRMFGDGQTGMQKVVDRAVERGELPAGLPARIISLPSDLARHELLMTLKPVPDATIEEIVDLVFMPLVRQHAGGGEQN
ncbi:MAG TPA: TetR/AcrR family transcriptional regulator [Galbitalea sp.]|jgi:AcrR family transcriptional regulator